MADELERLPDETLAEYLDRIKKIRENNQKILNESTNMTEWIKNDKSQQQMKNFRLNTIEQPFDFVESTPYEFYYTPPAALNHIDGLKLPGGRGRNTRQFSWGANATKYSNMQELLKRRLVSSNYSYFTFLRNATIDNFYPLLYYSCVEDVVNLNLGVKRNTINYSWIKNLKINPKTTANKETRLTISNSQIQGLDVENVKGDSDNPNLLSANFINNSNFKKYNNVGGQITQNHITDCDFTSANLRASIIGKNSFYQCDFSKVRFWSAQINDRRASSTAYDVSFGVNRITRNQYSNFWDCRFNKANFKEAYIGSGFPNKSLMGMREVINPFTADFDDEGNPIGYAKFSDSNNQWKNSYMHFKNSSFNSSILKDTSMAHIIMDNCTFNNTKLDRTTIQSSILTNNTFYESQFGQEFNRNGLTLKRCMINNMSFIRPSFLSLRYYSSPILIEKCSSANLIKQEPLADLPLDMRMSYFYYLLNKIDNNYNDSVISNDIALASLFLDNGYTTDVVFQEKNNEIGTQPNDTIKLLNIVGSDLDILFDDIKVADGNIMHNNLRITTKDTTFKRTYFSNNNIGLFRKRFRTRRYRELSPEYLPLLNKVDMPTGIKNLLRPDNTRGTHPLEIMPELSIRGDLQAIGSDYLFGKMENTKFENCIFELQESQFDWDWKGEEELINDMAELREFIRLEGRPIFNSTILKNSGDDEGRIIYGGVDANIPRGDLLFNPKAYKFIPLNFLVSMAKKGVEMDNCLIFPNSIRNMGTLFSGSGLSNLLGMVRNQRNEELSQEDVYTRISGAMMEYRNNINYKGIYPAPLIFSIKEGLISSPYFISEENPDGNICRLTSSLNPLLYGIGESNSTEGLSPLEISQLHFDMMKRKEGETEEAVEEETVEEEFVNDESFFDESFLERPFNLSFNQYLHQNELTDDEGTLTTYNNEKLANAMIDWLILSQRKLGIDDDELEEEMRLIRNSPLSWAEWLSNYDLRPSAIEGTPLDFWTEKFASLGEYLQMNEFMDSQGNFDNTIDDASIKNGIKEWFGNNKEKMDLDDDEITKINNTIRFGGYTPEFWLAFFEGFEVGGDLEVENL